MPAGLSTTDAWQWISICPAKVPCELEQTDFQSGRQKEHMNSLYYRCINSDGRIKQPCQSVCHRLLYCVMGVSRLTVLYLTPLQHRLWNAAERVSTFWACFASGAGLEQQHCPLLSLHLPVLSRGRPGAEAALYSRLQQGWVGRHILDVMIACVAIRILPQVNGPHGKCF